MTRSASRSDCRMRTGWLIRRAKQLPPETARSSNDSSRDSGRSADPAAARAAARLRQMLASAGPVHVVLAAMSRTVAGCCLGLRPGLPMAAIWSWIRRASSSSPACCALSSSRINAAIRCVLSTPAGSPRNSRSPLASATSLSLALAAAFCAFSAGSSISILERSAGRSGPAGSTPLDVGRPPTGRACA